MKGNKYERCKRVGEYIADSKKTVRETARYFEIGKSTVHKDVTEALPMMDLELAKRVREVLDFNKAERHIRGGLATKRKYQKEKLSS